ncbi:hypothetical protein [Cupriavidus oxalaticus]|uniref:hypothetical protein n=1 Tax=Cupriavidus oxalaticus TaxID=96344 RepID=UPI003F7357B0
MKRLASFRVEKFDVLVTRITITPRFDHPPFDAKQQAERQPAMYHACNPCFPSRHGEIKQTALFGIIVLSHPAGRNMAGALQ